MHRVEAVFIYAKPERAFILTQDLVHFAERLGGHFDMLFGLYESCDIFRQQCLIVVLAPGLIFDAVNGILGAFQVVQNTARQSIVCGEWSAWCEYAICKVLWLQ